MDNDDGVNDADDVEGRMAGPQCNRKERKTRR